MYVCMHACMHVCTYVRTYVCMHMCIVCVGMYVWACMCARMCARMCALSNVDPIMPYKSKWLIHLARFKVTITFTGLIEGGDLPECNHGQSWLAAGFALGLDPQSLEVFGE